MHRLLTMAEIAKFCPKILCLFLSQKITNMKIKAIFRSEMKTTKHILITFSKNFLIQRAKMSHNFWTKSYKICHCVAKSSFFSVADCKDKCVFKFQTDLDNSQKKQLPPVQNNFSFHRYFLRFILSNAKNTTIFIVSWVMEFLNHGYKISQILLNYAQCLQAT